MIIMTTPCRFQYLFVSLTTHNVECAQVILEENGKTSFARTKIKPFSVKNCLRFIERRTQIIFCTYGVHTRAELAIFAVYELSNFTAEKVISKLKQAPKYRLETAPMKCSTQ